jgi:hypothetical protein
LVSGVKSRTMADADVIREVTQCIERGDKKNRRIETALVILLVGLSVTGLVLLVIGAIRQQWGIALPGGLCELSIAMPIRSLVKLRQENIRLAVIPQMIRLADARSEKKLVMKFVETLISQVGS